MSEALDSSRWWNGLTLPEKKRLLPSWIEEMGHRIDRLVDQDKGIWEEIVRDRATIKEYEETLANLPEGEEANQ